MTSSYPVSRHTYRTPANIVTFVRIVLTPAVVAAIAIWAPSWWVFFFAFFVAFTDRIDGMLARKYGTSSVGVFLDSLSDKILVLGSMVVLVLEGTLWWLPVAIIAAREGAMSLWRSRFARQGRSIPARKSGKWKMWVQCFAVGLAVIPGLEANAKWVITGWLWIAVAFTLWSFAQYLFDARRTGDPAGRSAAERASHSAG